MTSVTLPDGTQVSYSYDSSGRRVSQSVGTQVTNYLWDEASPDGDVLLETDSDGNALVSYVLGGSQLLSQERNGTVSYYLHDGQQSVRTLTDNSGAISDQYSYSAFGELEEQSGSTANGYFYTGQQYDELTGLYSLRARYYDPTIGRLLSRDPAELDLTDPSELNRYVYVANNPILAYDPSGLVAATEYIKLNTTKHSEEVEGLYVEGQGVKGAYAQVQADLNAIEARLIYQNEIASYAQFLKGTVNSNTREALKKVTVGRGQIIIDGQPTQILTVSDFPPNVRGRPWPPQGEEAVNTLIQQLQGVANKYGWHYKGPLGPTPGGTGMTHAEQYIIDKALQMGAKRGDNVVIGISNPTGPCGPGSNTCQQLIFDKKTIDGIDIFVKYLNHAGDALAHFP